jgi:diguanylate cyclase (GGDEF)-like protein/PAS domain S-box-containing protein
MQLFRRTWPLVASNLLMLGTSVLCMAVLSAMRAYVGGESLWSKAQKDAVTHLRQFARSSDLTEFKRFRDALSIPLGDRVARLELQKPDPDPAIVTAGLRAGGIHPDDIAWMVRLFRFADDVPHMGRALQIWAQGDALIDRLDDVADQLLNEVTSNRLDPSGRTALLAQIDRLDFALRPLEDEFSEALGAASRVTTVVLEWIAALSSGLFLALGVVLSRSIMQRADSMERALRSSEQRVRAEQHRAQVTLASIYDGVLTADLQGRIDFLNSVACDITGWSLQEARGRPLTEVFRLTHEGRPDPVASALSQLRSGADPTDRLQGAVLIDRAGRSVPVECSLAPIRDEGDAASGIVAVVRDVSRERELASRLLHQATHDELTGLVNRRELERRLADALKLACESHEQSALLYLDLDQFKIVNDTCGHPAGDELIRRVTESIRGAVRNTDTLGRLGGDEFGLLLAACTAATALTIAEKIRTDLAELRFWWQDRMFVVGVSIGVVTLDRTFGSVAEVLSAADSACYLAKDAGRNRVQVYRPDDRKIRSRSGEMQWVARIAGALEESRFMLFAQDIRPISDGSLETGHEILLRLLDEDGELVLPMNFIPAAERYGLMPRLDRWVIERTLSELGALRRQGHPLPRLLVNLSAASLEDGELFAFVSSGLREHRVPPHRVGFELTETTAITQLTAATRLLNNLRSLGCSIGLDDFGAGMSSFGYLRRLPVDYLKIDGGFVHKMHTDPVDRAMVASIHRIGRVMGLRTVAERVECESVLTALREVGVDYAQGYAIARPVPLGALLQIERAAPDAGAIVPMPASAN